MTEKEKQKHNDKKIKEAILNGLIDCRDAPDLGWSNFGGIHIDDCIAWLEKQDEKASSQNNNNIDLTKILKDCPKGTKFYSYIFGDETYFQGFSLYGDKPISIVISGKKEEWQNVSLSRKGHPYNDECGECCIFPSREMRDWSKFSAPWYKKEKFDPKTLQPFNRVLVSVGGEWQCDFFSHMLSGGIFNKRCMGIGDMNVVIPYNDETKHLVGTTDKAPEFYRYWEDGEDD